MRDFFFVHSKLREIRETDIYERPFSFKENRKNMA